MRRPAIKAWRYEKMARRIERPEHRAGTKPTCLRIRVVDHAKGEQPAVNVSLPIGLVRFGLGMARTFSPKLKDVDIDWDLLAAAIDAGERGEIVHVEQVGMVQRGSCARLAPEALKCGGVVGHPDRQDLDGHLAVEAGIARLINLAHATGADQRVDLVGPEASAGWQWGR
jgi:hypothetical protein